MSNDARLNTSILQHPKIKKLNRKFGPQGPLSFIALILWVAANRSDGDLMGMDADDIELAIDWPLDPGALFEALIDLHLLDEVEPRHYVIHDWADHNPWAAGSDNRSDRARFAALTKRYGREKAVEMMPEYAQRLEPGQRPRDARDDKQTEEQCIPKAVAVPDKDPSSAGSAAQPCPTEAVALPESKVSDANGDGEQCSGGHDAERVAGSRIAHSSDEQCSDKQDVVLNPANSMLVAQSSTAPSPSPDLKQGVNHNSAAAPLDGDARQTNRAHRFAEFWAAYPKKSARRDALTAWQSRRFDPLADTIIADVQRRAARHKPWLDGYIPNPATYLRGERWNDEIEPPKSHIAPAMVATTAAASALSRAGQQTAVSAMQWLQREEDA